MKNTFLLCFALLIICSCNTKAETETNNITKTETNTTIKHLRHVVLFKFKETATASDIDLIEAAFIDLPSKIKEIKDLEWGINNSPEDLNKDFTHCFFVTFNSEEDRAIYLPHEAHLAFVEVLKPHLEDVLVLDYWTR